MQINNSSNKSNSLYHDTLYKLGIDRSDTTTLPVEDFIRSANNWYRRVNSWIWQVTGEWEYDDSNYSDLPYADADLEDGQQDYQLPSTAQKLDRVEILDSNGNGVKLIPIDKSQIDESMREFMETNGTPRYYDVMGRSVLLYPTPASANVTLTKGIRVYVSREISEFTTSSTADVPGFNDDFHEMISVGAAIDFAELVGDTNRSTQLNNRLASMKQDLAQFYGSNEREMMPNIAPNYRNHK